jgi:hypothetical protein
MSSEDVVQVINRAALIENLLDQVITDYCRPREAFTSF